MKQVFLIAALLILGIHWSIAQDKVIRWANDSVEVYRFDTIVNRIGDKLEGRLELKRSGNKIIYKVQKGFIVSRDTYNFRGIKTEEEHFMSRQLHGKYRLWNDQGILLIEGYYKNGLEDSHWVYYYNNGHKQIEGNFLADSTNLIEEFTFRFSVHEEEASGETLFKVIQSDSEYHPPLHGDWYVYDKKGNKLQKLHFNKGVLNGIYLSEL